MKTTTTQRQPNQTNGFSIIEVIVAISLVSFLVVSAGRTLDYTQRAHTTVAMKLKARAFAQQSIEELLAIQQASFACSCSQNSCIGSTCSRGPQSCQLQPSYTSCWLEYPAGLTGQNRFSIVGPAGTLTLQALSPGSRETITSDPRFSREMVITNATRNPASFELAPSGISDPSTKLITVSVYWQERGVTKSIQLSTILTGWKNL